MLILGFAVIALNSWEAEASSLDSVNELPDYGRLPEDSIFAGYLDVSGRHYYYVFVRAQQKPDAAPFLFWTNGGPGCSSVGEGLWMEHGPYKMNNRHPGLEPNPYSWNRFANVLYLEHPVGVGFSYSDEPSDYRKLNDNSEAEDLYQALITFFTSFHQFSHSLDHGLYLSGESYGGEYVPHLAHRIYFGENTLLKNALRGFAIANPALNCAGDKSGYSASLQYQLYFHHGLMSFDQFRKWAGANCDGRALEHDCQLLLEDAEKSVGTVNQQLLRRQIRKQWRKSLAFTQPGVEANFDPDHKYQSFCLGNATLTFADQDNADVGPCRPLGDPGLMATYLNRRDVQEALHVRSDRMASPIWTDCAGEWINYTSSHDNVLTSYFEPLFAATEPSSFRILVFSGDEDIATCPGPITQACLGELSPNVTRISKWRPWTTHNGITAGYFEMFDRYTYATVKGAGHTVPQYQPRTTFQLMSRWIANLTIEPHSEAIVSSV
eukprot:TRINITY_DN48935_c0_g1_i1.p1 TRINITY_DN48935_c0_g1~~TRINITY_DN48935_c0_g1_i1.p1  ORF type:complete len:493 (-),score=39.59 TRINITY_DN48935_c0_g1_i1:112-1590(-)